MLVTAASALARDGECKRRLRARGSGGWCLEDVELRDKRPGPRLAGKTNDESALVSVRQWFSAAGATDVSVYFEENATCAVTLTSIVVSGAL
jgi:hypothetical protein